MRFVIPIKLTEYLVKSTLQHTFRQLERTQRVLRFPSHRTCDHYSCRLSTAINSPQILLCELTHTPETFFPLLYVSAYLNLHGFVMHASSMVFIPSIDVSIVNLCVAVYACMSHLSHPASVSHADTFPEQSALLSAAKAIFQMSALVASP